MKAYQFIKYDGNTNIKHIKKYSENDVVLCFDFEDSIEFPKKEIARKYFSRISDNILNKFPSVETGVRINNNEIETEKDIEVLSNHHINTIILPKIETYEEIVLFEKLLAKKNVAYDEIIPAVENKRGLNNLASMVSKANPKIKRFAFGHCDYNFSINAFPFFHQNSIEYWKWIKELRSILLPKKISFLNSPYLELGNRYFFEAMVHYLNEIFGSPAAQTTLTTEQTLIVNKVGKKTEQSVFDFDKLIKHRLNLTVPTNLPENLIASYEKNKGDKGFSVTGKEKVLISPQEYQAALDYLAKEKEINKNLNIIYMGGCFPVQNDILFEDLFHQVLKRKIETEYDIKLNVNILRYENFTSCFRKLKKHRNFSRTDFLIFHIRPEPFLRIVKFLYRYLNDKEEVKHSPNLPWLKILNVERFDILKFEKSIVYAPQSNSMISHKLLVDMNYTAGMLLGNLGYAMNKYYELTDSIISYCINNGITPIILGVGNRSNSFLEPHLCKKLNNYIKPKIEEKGITYIETISFKSKGKDGYFSSNGIFATEKYHKTIAEILFSELTKPSR